MLVLSTLQTLLDEIEQKHGVKILYAVESGSRAWGFESQDSDYDVRFIYVHKLEHYLSLEEKKDQIQITIGDLDIVGWDIKKALKLLKKSNPCLLEWIQSPIIYRQNSKVMNDFRDLAKEYFSPKRSIYHYLHMAEGNYREYLQKDSVWTKKYFYVLRPILACYWINERHEPIPMEFQKLLDWGICQGCPEYDIILNLLERKKAGLEMSEGPKILELNEYVETGIDFFKEAVKELEENKVDPVKLDEFFRGVVGGIYDL